MLSNPRTPFWLRPVCQVLDQEPVLVWNSIGIHGLIDMFCCCPRSNPHGSHSQCSDWHHSWLLHLWAGLHQRCIQNLHADVALPCKYHTAWESDQCDLNTYFDKMASFVPGHLCELCLQAGSDKSPEAQKQTQTRDPSFSPTLQHTHG